MIAEVMKRRLLRSTYPICLPSHRCGLTQGLRHSTRPSTGNQTAFGLLNPANLVCFRGFQTVSCQISLLFKNQTLVKFCEFCCERKDTW